jgi:hypothetical protein
MGKFHGRILLGGQGTLMVNLRRMTYTHRREDVVKTFYRKGIAGMVMVSVVALEPEGSSTECLIGWKVEAKIGTLS